MKHAALVRFLLCLAVVLVLEFVTQTGIVTRFAIIPPSEMLTSLWKIMLSGKFNVQILRTLGSIVVSGILSVIVGFGIGIGLHAWPRARRASDPYLASFYAVPIFVFYPMFIVLFGLNRIPVMLIAFLLATVAVITSTLNGLDRVPRIQLKAAKIMRMDRWSTTLLIILPSAFPYFLTGFKFAIAFSFVGTLGAEFILANQGLGYEIAFAFNDFDNRTMYALIVFVLIVVSLVNMALFAWERRVLSRRGMA